MEPIWEQDKRDGYTYDARIKRGDTTFWAETKGTIATDSTGDVVVVRVSSARLHSFLQHIYGDFEFALSVPADPGASTNQAWGLRNSKDTSVSCAYFQIDTDGNFKAVSADDFGNTQETALTWDTDWTGAIARYRIIWEEDQVKFLINDTVVATHTERVGTKPQALEITNNVTSNLDMHFVRVARAGAIV